MARRHNRSVCDALVGSQVAGPISVPPLCSILAFSAFTFTTPFFPDNENQSAGLRAKTPRLPHTLRLALLKAILFVHRHFTPSPLHPPSILHPPPSINTPSTTPPTPRHTMVGKKSGRALLRDEGMCMLRRLSPMVIAYMTHPDHRTHAPLPVPSP